MDKVTHPTIAMSAVKSSQIESIGHDDKTNTLAIKFKGGDTIYHYPEFTAAEFDKFKGAESVGKHFGAHIKTRKFVKLPAKK